MGRYRGPSCKICRRNREKLFLKGEKCFTAKCEIEKRNTPPGPQPNMPRKLSEYGIRLREKQKLRFFYGVSESQMRIRFAQASRQKGLTGHNLLIMFEQRIDNVVYRAGFARSRKEARQLVRHRHFLINSKLTDIPSARLSPGDVVTVREQGESKYFKKRLEAMPSDSLPTWMSYEKTKKQIKLLHEPKREEIDVPVEEQLIVEYYSR